MGKQESIVERKLCDGVKAIGGKAYKLISPGSNGIPDRLVCLPGGRTIFVELKSPSGELSKQQEHRIAELLRTGQQVYVLYSVADVNAFLETVKGVIPDEVHTP